MWAWVLWTAVPDAGVIERAPRAVSWSRDLAPTDARRLAPALDSALEEPWDTRNFKTGEERQVTNCRQALTLPDGFEPLGPESDYPVFVAMQVRCRVLAELPSLKPALLDYLGAFALDDARLDELPAVLIPTASRNEQRALEAATAKRVSWKLADTGVRAGKPRHGKVLIESPRTRCFVEVLARGDIDGDGIEDLFLWRSGGGRKGTWATTDVFVLTRRTAEGRIEIIRRIGYPAK